MLRASQRGDEQAVVANEAIFAEKDFESRPATERDLLHLTFARSYYDLKNWKQAVAHFNEVPSNSNLIVGAFSGAAWAHLNLAQYLDAINKSTNIILGSLSKTYEPAAYETLSIALFETCNYQQTVQIFNHFRHVYGKSYFFLKDAQKNQTGFYNKLTAYVLGKKGEKTPGRVAGEWSADPVFLANQSEINLILDEEAASTKIRGSANQWTRFAKSASWTDFNGRLTQLAKENETRQTKLIAEINDALREKSVKMFEALNQTTQNLQLLEAETYETIGNKYLAENSPNQPDKQARTLSSTQNNHPVWNWGSYPISDSDDDSAETWDDELGYLRVKMKDSCR